MSLATLSAKVAAVDSGGALGNGPEGVGAINLLKSSNDNGSTQVNSGLIGPASRKFAPQHRSLRRKS